jgi:hypothetical protein
MKTRKKVFVAAACFLMLLTSRPVKTVAQDALSDVIAWTDSLALEERLDAPDGVYTVWPVASIDSHGGFIVVDRRERQVRLYDREGNLNDYFGRRGQGPGEFNTPTTALRLSSGHVLVPDIHGGTISRFDEDGNFVEKTPRLFRRIYQIHRLPNDDEILVAGLQAQGEDQRRQPGSFPLLHRFNLESEEIVRSFFPHPIPLGSYGNILFGIGHMASADVFGNQIVVAFAPQGKLYFFDVSGAPTGSVDIPLEHFRALEDLDVGSGTLSSSEIWDYSTMHSEINKVQWLREDVILVKYWDLIEREPWTTQNNVAAVTPEGTLLFDIADTPRFLTADRNTQELFFSDPDYEVENRWKVGRLIESVFE